MRLQKLLLLIFLAASQAMGQTPTRPLLNACDVLKNPKQYHKKVIYINVVLDASIEERVLRPERSCSAFEGIAFTTDQDFEELNDPNIRDEFEAALNPLLFIPEEKSTISRYAFVARTRLTIKGYFIASGKREFGRFSSNKYLLYIRQILDIGEPKLLQVGTKEYWDGP